ncbi:MAG: hypothetical protein GKS00_08005 [Alphaproteobacteria bacterium]|nr:hypothetical protein [Alphaproteobacteria bacterium]
MQIAGLSATEPSAPTRDRERDGKQTARDRFSTGSRFSPTHIILDLSREAMEQIGQGPLSRSRPPKPLLFIYDHSGAFAYDEPMPVQDGRRTVSPPHNEERAETPMPSIVAFDGMLDPPSF